MWKWFRECSQHISIHPLWGFHQRKKARMILVYINRKALMTGALSTPEAWRAILVVSRNCRAPSAPPVVVRTPGWEVVCLGFYFILQILTGILRKPEPNYLQKKKQIRAVQMLLARQFSAARNFIVFISCPQVPGYWDPSPHPGISPHIFFVSYFKGFHASKLNLKIPICYSEALPLLLFSLQDFLSFDWKAN